ncbi:MAG: kinase, partial [Kiritimatiellia bacterium]|nr:kinase [Kiritimatiellia bacterium]
MIISRTPFRISFFGGGSDFPEFYKDHPGCTLSTTIDKYCYISLHYLSPFFKFRFRASYAKTETVNQASEFQHPLIRECLQYLPTEHGLEIAHVSDLPGRTGLGTSSSFTVGLLNALHAIRSENASSDQLAR